MKLTVSSSGKLWFYAFKIKSLFRSDEFRTAFANIGNIKSLLPKKLNIMALIATSTKLSRVKSWLAMEDAVLIGLPPDRLT